MNAVSSTTMTAQERRSSVALACIFALRMLGLFLVLPVFSLAAKDYHGGHDPALVGLALGVYGLTQALLQLPLGMASDRMGRKRIIIFGLVVFAVGSLIAALTDSIWGLIAGRAIQGAGAVSAATTALLSDQTRDVVRTKAMALVGISIGMTFALSLVLGPWLAGHVGLAGLFGLTLALAVIGIAAVIWVVPAEPFQNHRRQQHPRQHAWQDLQTLAHQPDLMRLNFGVFILHTVQMAMWSAVPGLILAAGLAKEQHWHLYLPTIALSIVGMGLLLSLEKRGRLRPAMLLGIGMIAIAQLLFAMATAGHMAPSLWSLGALLLVFFCGFNMLEATQPSLLSRMAPPALRGTAMGMYSTLQSIGLFAGGALGGWLFKSWGSAGVFCLTTMACLIWLPVHWHLRPPALPSQQSAS